jgi:leucine dehydrogenase
MTDKYSNFQAFEEDFFTYAENRGFGDIHFKVDKTTGLCAIVAIHSTKHGPALGGCRFHEYSSTGAALHDVMRLARAMTYKSILAGLPLGGGKSVLIKPSSKFDRKALFKSFGRFIQDLNGRYITAEDIGTTSFDMDTIREETTYVSGLTAQGEPSPFTTQGVLLGMKAAIQSKMNTDSFKGLRIAIQGLGKVGYGLGKELHKQGAQLIITDINTAIINQFVKDFGATVVSPEDIYSVDCDIFAPCAFGAVLNENTIPLIKASIVAGSANNQLKNDNDGDLLHKKNILYAPDYVINAGGLIYAAGHYYKTPKDKMEQQLNNIYDSLLSIFKRSAKENKSTSEIADEIALEKL